MQADESVLERDGKSVPLTPKMFDTLLVLVENHGKVVDKDTLLKEVWPDSFVEEGNIAFNIRQLRKVLDDDARVPSYIETVPKRGYRFVAEVEKLLPDTASENGNGNAAAVSQAAIENEPSRLKKFVFPTLAILALAVGGVIAWQFARPDSSNLPILATPFASEKLSTTGMVFGAAISPDGKRVVYSSRTGNKESVWLRELDSANNVPIIPASEGNYYGFAFAPDGNSIYYSRKTTGANQRVEIYRIPVFGGVPEKLLETDEGWLSISSDGNQIAFVRCPRLEDEWCSLWIADAKDGNNQRKLVSRQNPIRIGDVEISPDGTRIAFTVGQSRNAANEFGLAEYDLRTGTERPITEEKFFNIKHLTWLPDQSGLLLTASRVPNKYFRVWQVSSSSGAAEPLTEDSEAYSILSLDKDAKRLVSTQIKQDFRVNVFSFDNPNEKRLLADASRTSFAPDGRIYFSSTMTGNDEIWTINPDGSGQRQLTNDLGGDGWPIVSPNSKAIFFTSNRAGQAHIWRMNADGSSQTQVTKNEGGIAVFVSTDGKTLYFRHAIHGTLWSVSLESGEEKSFFDRPKPSFAFSPDGSMFAFEEKNGENLVLTIASSGERTAIKTLEIPRERPKLLEFAWMPDGKSLILLMTDADYLKNSIYQLFLDGRSRKIVDLAEEQASSLEISPDGKSFSLVQGGWRHDAVLITGLR